MKRPSIRTRRSAATVLLAVVLVATAMAAVPPGYRYIGSRNVSAGRVILWYWNPAVLEPGGSPASFAARLFARAVDIDQERPYVALVRCDDRTYKPASEAGPFLPIDDGEPIAAVYRAGCANGMPVTVAQRYARLDGVGNVAAAPAIGGPAATSGAVAPQVSAGAAAGTPPVAASPSPAPTTGAPTRPAAQAAPTPAAPTPESAKSDAPAADPRRADACVRFAIVRGTPAGDATITNACTYPVEVALCFKGAGGGPHDCATPARGRLVDSLAPGVTHVLPEYRQTRHRGIASVACRGAPGTVFPHLEEPGRSRCT